MGGPIHIFLKVTNQPEFTAQRDLLHQITASGSLHEIRPP